MGVRGDAGRRRRLLDRPLQLLHLRPPDARMALDPARPRRDHRLDRPAHRPDVLLGRRPGWAPPGRTTRRASGTTRGGSATWRRFAARTTLSWRRSFPRCSIVSPRRSATPPPPIPPARSRFDDHLAEVAYCDSRCHARRRVRAWLDCRASPDTAPRRRRRRPPVLHGLQRRRPGEYPGAAEICGDGIDQNCDGSDSTTCNSPSPLGARPPVTLYIGAPAVIQLVIVAICAAVRHGRMPGHSSGMRAFVQPVSVRRDHLRDHAVGDVVRNDQLAAGARRHGLRSRRAHVHDARVEAGRVAQVDVVRPVVALAGSAAGPEDRRHLRERRRAAGAACRAAARTAVAAASAVPVVPPRPAAPPLVPPRPAVPPLLPPRPALSPAPPRPALPPSLPPRPAVPPLLPPRPASPVVPPRPFVLPPVPPAPLPAVPVSPPAPALPCVPAWPVVPAVPPLLPATPPPPLPAVPPPPVSPPQPGAPATNASAPKNTHDRIEKLSFMGASEGENRRHRTTV